MAPVRLLTLCMTFLLLARCAREVIIELPEEQPKIVAVCHFTDAQHFRVNITTSQPVNDGEDPNAPTNVEASLSVKGKFYDLLYRTKGDGKEYFWRSHEKKLAFAGTEYTLVVKVPGFPTIEANSTIPIHHPVAPVQIKQGDIVVENRSDGSREWRIPIELSVQDLPSEERYFAFYLTHDMVVFEPGDPNSVDYTEEQLPTNFLADGRTISLLHNIPEPVVLVNENYWSEDRKTLYLTARIPFNPDTERPEKMYITWRTLSPEFYRYHLSLSRQGGNLPLNDPDAVFNNIDSGLGNFSGYSFSVDTIVLPVF